LSVNQSVSSTNGRTHILTLHSASTLCFLSQSILSVLKTNFLYLRKTLCWGLVWSHTALRYWNIPSTVI